MPSDDDEHIQRKYGRPERPRNRCKVCQIPMNSEAENRLGVHVRCVYDVSVKMKKYEIPGPRYGRARPKG
jgi:hypothetical protein